MAATDARSRSRIKQVLFVMDPLPKLDPVWDNSLALAREMAKHKIATWWADAPELHFESGRIFAKARRFAPANKNLFHSAPPVLRDAARFDLILLRKEPPFDLGYLHLTYLLECAQRFTPVVNDPRGVRNTLEKWAPLLVRAPAPQTLISASAKKILAFRKKLGRKMVLKRLDERGGRGVLLLSRSTAAARRQIRKLTDNGKIPAAAQAFIQSPHGADKRILILNGQILGVFEKRPKRGEFRSNLSLGGTARPAALTLAEKHLVRKLRPWLRQNGLAVAGLDVMGGKLLEVNVTSPAGFTDLRALYPKRDFIAAWLDSLQRLPRPKLR